MYDLCHFSQIENFCRQHQRDLLNEIELYQLRKLSLSQSANRWHKGWTHIRSRMGRKLIHWGEKLEDTSQTIPV